MKYLDPKANVTFCAVFGKNVDLAISLLNALLPFDRPEEMIVQLEYVPIGQRPENSLQVFSMMFVHCYNGKGDEFFVEIQTRWSDEINKRLSFSSLGKCMIRPIGRKEYNAYTHPFPIYSLNLVDVALGLQSDGYYHYFPKVYGGNGNLIDNLHLVCIELPKFTPHTYTEKKMQALWLRFLTEIDGRTREIPQELLDNPEIKKAVDQIEQSAFNDAQLLGYDEFWDAVRVEKTLVSDALKEGMEKGLAEGMEKGMAEGMEKGMEKGMAEGRAEGLVEGQAKGRAEGERNKQIEIARKMKQAGMDAETIARLTGLATDEIDAL